MKLRKLPFFNAASGVAIARIGMTHLAQRIFSSRLPTGVGAHFGGSMKKFSSLIGISALVLLGFALAPAAHAGSVTLSISSSNSTETTFTISGVYAGSGVPSTEMSANGLPYSFSFSLSTNPSLTDFNGVTLNPGQYDAADGIFLMTTSQTVFTLGSGASAKTVTFNTPFEIQFDTFFVAGVGGNAATFNPGSLGNPGGLEICFDDTSCSSGTFWDIVGQQLFTGSVANPKFITGVAGVNQTMSGYEVDNLGPFPFGTSPTPEPASLLLLGTGLFGLGIVLRRRLKLN